MKVIIAFTIPLVERNDKDPCYHEWIKDTINQTHSSACDIIHKDLKYQILKYSLGIHRNSPNLHAHITYVCSVNNAKYYKILNDKIKRSNFNNLPNKTNITFCYDNDAKYDEFKALAYNLKEYCTVNLMEEDYSRYHEEISDEVKQELEELRKYGNEQYLLSQKYKEQKHKDKQDKKDLKNNMYSYLELKIDHEQKQFSQLLDIGVITQHVRWISYHILQFYKENNKSFSIAHLKNQALNFLYNKDYITEDQILTYAHI